MTPEKLARVFARRYIPTFLLWISPFSVPHFVGLVVLCRYVEVEITFKRPRKSVDV